jgi:hypothetical protein
MFQNVTAKSNDHFTNVKLEDLLQTENMRWIEEMCMKLEGQIWQDPGK